MCNKLHSSRIEPDCAVGACGEDPRLHRMPANIQDAELVAFLVRLQLLERHNQGILQQITREEDRQISMGCIMEYPLDTHL